MTALKRSVQESTARPRFKLVHRIGAWYDAEAYLRWRARLRRPFGMPVPQRSGPDCATWLHRGTIVVADNVKIPGAPAYRAFMRQQNGAGWRTIEHNTHGEYGSVIPDLVLESEYLGG